MLDGNIPDIVAGSAVTLGILTIGKSLLNKFLASNQLNTTEFAAREDVIVTLQKQIETLASRVNDLESKVAHLQDRLIATRSHALVAYGIVQNQCANCPKNDQRPLLLDMLTKILSND